jgi:hypothetical protein
MFGLSEIRNISALDLTDSFLPYITRNKFQPTNTATATIAPTSTNTATNTPGGPSPTVSITATQTPTPVIMPGKVVHVHSDDATNWDYGGEYYGDFVNQSVINNMVGQGVMELTNTSTVSQAWKILIPNYSPGKSIVIKVNFNNCWWCNVCRTNCEDWQLAIDGLIHPINSVISGLFQAYPNFIDSDIWIYDATLGDNPPLSTRAIPQRFKDGCQYQNVGYFDHYCNEVSGYTSQDPSALVTWFNPPNIPNPPSVQVTDLLLNATYLINIPIMKQHIGAGVTLSFKNHLGSIADPGTLHEWIWGSYYGGKEYSVLVDIFLNSHIFNKTVLTIGDGLFGNRDDNRTKPTPWHTFNNEAPNSLLLSTDSVALDCVMCDLLHAELPIWNEADDYLVYAANIGLGIYERCDPWGSGYYLIDYTRLEL